MEDQDSDTYKLRVAKMNYNNLLKRYESKSIMDINFAISFAFFICLIIFGIRINSKCTEINETNAAVGIWFLGALSVVFFMNGFYQVTPTYLFNKFKNKSIFRK
jgi:hypothetical protein